MMTETILLNNLKSLLIRFAAAPELDGNRQKITQEIEFTESDLVNRFNWDWEALELMEIEIMNRL